MEFQVGDKVMLKVSPWKGVVHFGKQGKLNLDSVMSDSDESGITHMEVSSPFEDLSDIGSPRADDHELLELPYMPEDPHLEAALQAPPSVMVVPRLCCLPENQSKHLKTLIAKLDVPGAEHADDEIIAEDQPYAKDADRAGFTP
ncbi:hypothetical protein Tco_0531463 [Tanacetum coccineum]